MKVVVVADAVWNPRGESENSVNSNHIRLNGTKFRLKKVDHPSSFPHFQFKYIHNFITNSNKLPTPGQIPIRISQQYPESRWRIGTTSSEETASACQTKLIVTYSPPQYYSRKSLKGFSGWIFTFHFSLFPLRHDFSRTNLLNPIFHPAILNISTFSIGYYVLNMKFILKNSPVFGPSRSALDWTASQENDFDTRAIYPPWPLENVFRGKICGFRTITSHTFSHTRMKPKHRKR